MKKLIVPLVVSASLLGVAICWADKPPAKAPTLEASALRGRVKDAIDLGIKFMRTQQDKAGSYGRYPGLTGMVVEAYALSPRKYREADGPWIRNAVTYLVGLQKKDGAIYDQNLPSYNTALSVLALAALENPKHAEVIAKGQRFLVGLQADEGEKFTKEDRFFGGIGYGSDERPDLSNLQLSLEALKGSGYKDRKVYEKALVFLNRVQNRSESNDQPWAKDDGGFVYAPNETKAKAGGMASYGSMTYAGLKSLMYCDVKADDPRIKDGWKWVQANWDLAQHPGMGSTGLYFYYQTLSKTLAARGERILVDSRGRDHDWYAELATKLLSLQAKDGSWKNDDPRYWEGNPLLATARAVLALSYGYELWPFEGAAK